MALDLKQQRYLKRFFPPLVDSVIALGAGEFEFQPPKLVAGMGGIRRVRLCCVYKLRDGKIIEIENQFRLKPGSPAYVPTEFDLDPVNHAHWERFHYTQSYGLPLRAKREFGVDLDDVYGYHVHLRGNPDEHVPVNDVEPDLRNLDSCAFVKMVADYRTTQVYPAKKKRQ